MSKKIIMLLALSMAIPAVSVRSELTTTTKCNIGSGISGVIALVSTGVATYAYRRDKAASKEKVEALRADTKSDQSLIQRAQFIKEAQNEKSRLFYGALTIAGVAASTCGISYGSGLYSLRLDKLEFERQKSEAEEARKKARRLKNEKLRNSASAALERSKNRIAFEKAKAKFDQDFPRGRLARAGDELSLLLTKKDTKSSGHKVLSFLNECKLERAAVKIQSLFRRWQAHKQLRSIQRNEQSSFDLGSFELTRYQKSGKPSFDVSDFEKNRYGQKPSSIQILSEVEDDEMSDSSDSGDSDSGNTRLTGQSFPDTVFLLNDHELKTLTEFEESTSALDEANNALDESWTEITQKYAQQAAGDHDDARAGRLAEMQSLFDDAKNQVAAYQGMFDQNRTEYSGNLFNYNQKKLNKGLSIAQQHLTKVGAELETLNKLFKYAGQ